MRWKTISSCSRAATTTSQGSKIPGEAKAALLPSLAVSATQGYTNYPSSNAEDNNSYTGTYGINAGLTLYEGGKLRTAVKEQRLQNRIDALSVAESANDIRIAIVEAYMQALYAAEAVEVAAGTAEVSRAQRDRAEQMWQAGSISKVDFAQLESQYASDLYQVVVARSSLDDYKLQLKQLLELDITEEMNLAAPAEGEETVLQALPAKTDIYATALDAMPQIERGRLGVETAELGIREARAGFYPSVSLTAGLGTGHMTGGGFQSGSQVWNRFNENVALSVSIPIFSNRKNRTAVNKARIAVSNSRLEQLGLEKELLRKVESAYLDVISSQSRYTAARQKGTLCPAELRPHRRAVPRRPEEHRRTDYGAERTFVGTAGGVAGQVHGAAQHQAARHLSGTIAPPEIENDR